jgi:hypothetical protein
MANNVTFYGFLRLIGMVVYHLSPSNKRDLIIKEGLKPKAYNGVIIKYEPRIFVSNSKKNLAFDYVGYENVDVWEVETEQPLFKDLFSFFNGHFYLKNPVPVENIKLIKCY